MDLMSVVSFLSVSLLVISIVLFSKSFGPKASLMGTPLSSYSANFHPGLLFFLLSIL